MASVIIDRISKSFGQTKVLKSVSLSIAEGEFVSLVGPSGCGKSTLLRIIAGLELQDSGRIFLGERSVDALRAAERNLAMVFQSYALYPHLTAGENIAVPLRMRRLTALQRLPLVGRLLPGTRAVLHGINGDVGRAADVLDIEHLLDRKPAQLSGGQRQRVAVGRALVREPEAFLLDEPLSNLDAKLRMHMRSEIAQLHRRLDTTFIYVTHDQAEAMTMSNRIAVMMDGEIIQTGSPDEIYDRPVDLRVAEFIGSPKINVLPAAIDGGGVVSLLGDDLGLRAALPAGPASLGVRPEATKLTGREGALRGTVAHAENLGSEIFVQVALDGVETPIVARADHGSGWTTRLGETVGVEFDLARAVLFDRAGRAVENEVRQSRRAARG